MRNSWPSVLAVVGLLVVASCRTPTPDLSPVSSQAIADYRDARSIYLDAITRGARGEELRSAMQSALELLEGAIDKPPPQPMFLAARAELLALDTTQPGDRVERAYRDVIDLCPQWIPAYAALARLAARRGDIADAEAHIARGEELLVELETFRRVEWIGPWHPDFWRGVPFYDPTLPEEVRNAGIHDQLAAAFTWHDGLREPESTPTDSSLPAGGEIGRRLRARLLFERTRIREITFEVERGKGRGPALRRMLAEIDESVLRLDAEFLEAELLRVECLVGLGEHRAAERTLLGLTNPARTRLARDPRLLGALLDVYVEWTIASRAETLDADPENDAAALARVEELDAAIGDVFVRLGALEDIEPRALLSMAEFVVVKSEWLPSQDPDVLVLLDTRLLPAARNAITRAGEESLRPAALELQQRTTTLRRAALANRKSNAQENSR